MKKFLIAFLTIILATFCIGCNDTASNKKPIVESYRGEIKFELPFKASKVQIGTLPYMHFKTNLNTDKMVSKINEMENVTAVAKDFKIFIKYEKDAKKYYFYITRSDNHNFDYVLSNMKYSIEEGYDELMLPMHLINFTLVGATYLEDLKIGKYNVIKFNCEIEEVIAFYEENDFTVTYENNKVTIKEEKGVFVNGGYVKGESLLSEISFTLYEGDWVFNYKK